MESNKTDNGVRLIELPKVNDPRGNLTFIESGQHVPFKVQQEFIVALSGSFDVVVNDGSQQRTFHLARPQIGLYIPPMTWRHIDNFSTNSVALVLSDTFYDADDYIEDFDAFKTLKNGND